MSDTKHKPRSFRVWVGVNMGNLIAHTTRSTRKGVKIALTQEIGEDWAKYCDVHRATVILDASKKGRKP